MWNIILGENSRYSYIIHVVLIMFESSLIWKTPTMIFTFHNEGLTVFSLIIWRGLVLKIDSLMADEYSFMLIVRNFTLYILTRLKEFRDQIRRYRNLLVIIWETREFLIFREKIKIAILFLFLFSLLFCELFAFWDTVSQRKCLLVSLISLWVSLVHENRVYILLWYNRLI